MRDNLACVMCGGRERLEVGHIISLRDGCALGLSNAVLFGDDNLAAMCASCNSGLSSKSIPAHRLLVLLALRAQEIRGGRS